MHSFVVFVDKSALWIAGTDGGTGAGFGEEDAPTLSILHKHNNIQQFCSAYSIGISRELFAINLLHWQSDCCQLAK